MASQGNPGKLGKSEGWKTNEGAYATPDATCCLAKCQDAKEEGTKNALFPKKGVMLVADSCISDRL